MSDNENVDVAELAELVSKLEGVLASTQKDTERLMGMVATLSKRLDKVEKAAASGGGGGAANGKTSARAVARRRAQNNTLPRGFKRADGAANGRARPQTAHAGGRSPANSAASSDSGGRARPRTAGANRKKKPAAMPKLSSASRIKEDGLDELDPARRGHYYVGKTKVQVALPQSFMDAHPEFKAEREERSKKGMDEAKSNGSEPSKDLELRFAYGYNGANSHANLFYHPEDDHTLIYSLAAAGVVFNKAENTQAFFLEHNEDISCLARHPTKPIVATGQVDPKGKEQPFVCVWDADSRKLLAKYVNFHDREIVAVAFSPDGKYVASVGADDNHTMALWQWEKNSGTPPKGKAKKGKLPASVPDATHATAKNEVYAIAFNPKPTKEESDYEIAVVGVKLAIFLGVKLDKARGKWSESKLSYYAKTKKSQKAFHCVSFSANGDCFTGTATGEVYHSHGSEFQSAIKTHGAKKKPTPVTGVLALRDGGFVAGGKDGVLEVFDSDFKVQSSIKLSGSKPEPVAFAQSASGVVAVGTKGNELYEVDFKEDEAHLVTSGHSAQVWALAVHPSEEVMVTGAHDKLLRAWNFADHRAVDGKQLAFKSPVRCAAFNADGSKIVVGLKNGSLHLVDYASFEVVTKKKVAKETIDTVEFSPSGETIAAGSWDQNVYVVDSESLEVKHTMKGHSSSVLMVNHSGDGKYIMSNSKDYEILYWNAQTGKRVKKGIEVVDVEFPTWNCFLGWAVQGIWRDVEDGTDINAVANSHSGDLLVTGDDFGNVRLYEYPSVHPRAPYKAFRGHSSHVTKVRFSNNDEYVFSAGGADTGVFQWQVR